LNFHEWNDASDAARMRAYFESQARSKTSEARDKMMQTVGGLSAAMDILERANPQSDEARAHWIEGTRLIRKALLREWDAADNSGLNTGAGTPTRPSGNKLLEPSAGGCPQITSASTFDGGAEHGNS